MTHLEGVAALTQQPYEDTVKKKHLQLLTSDTHCTNASTDSQDVNVPAVNLRPYTPFSDCGSGSSIAA